MYWQVYLHKTVLSAENILMKVLLRAREIAPQVIQKVTGSLTYFLLKKEGFEDLHEDKKTLEFYCQLDDFDVFTALKGWCLHPDQILSYLSNAIVNRQLFKVELSNSEFSGERIAALRQKISRHFNLSEKDSDYLLISGETSNHAYHPQQASINIIYKDGSIKDISEASDQLNISVLSHPVTKHFLCYPKIFAE